MIFQLKENAALKSLPQEIADLRKKLDNLRSVESDFKKQSVVLSKTQDKLNELIEELQKERGEKMDILSEKDTIQNEFDKLKNDWNNAKNNLETEIISLKEEIENNKDNAKSKYVFVH